MKTPLFPLLFTLMAACPHAQAELQKDIRSFDWPSYFNKQYAECLEYEIYKNRAVELLPIIYHDFDGDGRDEALVTGSSCNTGTAGPDIHSVFKLNPDGALTELKFNEDAKGAKVTGIPLPLIGNRNWMMTVKQDLLCNQFFDGSGVKIAKEECYAFNNGQFVLTSIAYAQTSETSFDCHNAKKDREIVACRLPEMAKLDVELAKEYGALLRSLLEAEKSALIASQIKWLHDLDAWHAYKWTDDLAEKYQKRILELRNYKAASPGAAGQPPGSGRH